MVAAPGMVDLLFVSPACLGLETVWRCEDCCCFREAFSLHYIAMFVLGMLGCELTYSARPAACLLRDRCPWKALAWAAAGLLLLASSGAIRRFSSDHAIDLLVGLMTLCLLVTMETRQESLIKRPFMSKPAPKTEKQAEAAAVYSPAP